MEEGTDSISPGAEGTPWRLHWGGPLTPVPAGPAQGLLIGQDVSLQTFPVCRQREEGG